MPPGVIREVVFERADGPTDDRVDDDYRVKYRSSPYLVPMIRKRARAATVRVTPRGCNG